MFRHDLTSSQYQKVYLNCFLLSLLSGCVNAGAFLAVGSFATHVTGFATLFGIDVVKGDWVGALGTMSVPIYFLAGSMISGYFVDRRIFQKKKPRYFLVMMLVCLCLVTVAVGGQMEYFGLFGRSYNVRHDYLFLVLLCGASGIQNAAITTFSGSNVRTTHLTGVTTDLGVGLVRVFFKKLSGVDQVHEMRNNWLRIITLLAFVLGSIVGAFSFGKMHYLGFLIPAGIAAYAAIVSL